MHVEKYTKSAICFGIIIGQPTISAIRIYVLIKRNLIITYVSGKNLTFPITRSGFHKSSARTEQM